MNAGMQDAFNLAWKLSLVIGDVCKPTLLDSYSVERSAVGDRVLRNASRMTDAAIMRNPIAQGLRNAVVNFAFGFPQLGHRAANTLAELDIGYPESPLTVTGAHHSTATNAGRIAFRPTSPKPVSPRSVRPRSPPDWRPRFRCWSRQRPQAAGPTPRTSPSSAPTAMSASLARRLTGPAPKPISRPWRRGREAGYVERARSRSSPAQDARGPVDLGTRVQRFRDFAACYRQIVFGIVVNIGAALVERPLLAVAFHEAARIQDRQAGLARRLRRLFNVRDPLGEQSTIRQTHRHVWHDEHGAIEQSLQRRHSFGDVRR